MDIERSAGVTAMSGVSGLEEQWSWREVKGAPGSSPLFILTSLLALPGLQEARHTSALPVLRHGGGRAVRQLHVLRGEAALVRAGGRPAAGRQHLRRLRRGLRPLRGLAEGERPACGGLGWGGGEPWACGGFADCNGRT